MNMLIANDLFEDMLTNRRPRIFRGRINFLEIERPPSTFREDFRVDLSIVEELTVA